MITIIFESHATTEDNEAMLAAGWYDVALSKLGETQAKQLGDRYAGQTFDAIFCSDLQRSYRTAEIAFGNTYPIIRDRRLRECNYGDLSRHSKAEIDLWRAQAITKPFPNGESYQDSSKRMRSFLDYLAADYESKTVMIIGHRATQYGLDQLVNGKSLEDAVLAPWQWQPGWKYEFEPRQTSTA
jgi:broad specificity phosphatase PhoE